MRIVLTQIIGDRRSPILQQEGRYPSAETLSRIAIETYSGVGHAPDLLQLNVARGLDEHPGL